MDDEGSRVGKGIHQRQRHLRVKLRFYVLILVKSTTQKSIIIIIIVINQAIWPADLPILSRAPSLNSHSYSGSPF
ncbi:hypothetical protein BDQ94DRAFT_57760 [Aspergillus welwitschiae]|uniref:Uncharacterized protein n=1 Tax=Aspergillus welwitschiae TaxID=1341132 RepID=A0A3F3PXK8_9EURO|nr:hypothetical protein BDQ94DRAFT_57760 [Aspergillus welwitschiae]RDH31502.1 hypothetical protein BDQ94DRAFT_57760 [Aspergillus welwitschiae]